MRNNIEYLLSIVKEVYGEAKVINYGFGPSFSAFPSRHLTASFNWYQAIQLLGEEEFITRLKAKRQIYHIDMGEWDGDTSDIAIYKGQVELGAHMDLNIGTNQVRHLEFGLTWIPSTVRIGYVERMGYDC